MKRRRIGVLMGGDSHHDEHSLGVGDSLCRALSLRGHEAVRIYVDSDLDRSLRAAEIDVALLALSGTRSLSGCVQGLLELLDIPYTGSSILATALAMDKLKAKELFRLHNLPTAPYYLHRRGRGAIIEQHGSFGFPVVVKPRSGSASLGVRRCDDVEELEAAVERALALDEHVLVERFVEGVEVHVALLGDRMLGAAEIHSSRPIYDYAARAGIAHVELHLPPRLSADRVRGVVTLAERAASALGVTGLCEVDLLVSAQGNEVILEVDAQPSLSSDGVVARIAGARGWELADLVEELLMHAALHTRRRAPLEDRRIDTLPFAGLERRSPSLEPH